MVSSCQYLLYFSCTTESLYLKENRMVKCPFLKYEGRLTSKADQQKVGCKLRQMGKLRGKAARSQRR